MTIRSIFRLLGCIALVFCVPFLSSFLMTPKGELWFDQLTKPSFMPPEIVFPIVWNILYLLMGIALWLVVESHQVPHRKTSAYTVFGLQLFFNLNWTFSFFFLRSPLYALVDLVILIFFVTSTLVMFKKFSKAAALLILPYYIWIYFALALNIAIIWVN